MSLGADGAVVGVHVRAVVGVMDVYRDEVVGVALRNYLCGSVAGSCLPGAGSGSIDGRGAGGVVGWDERG